MLITILVKHYSHVKRGTKMTKVSNWSDEEVKTLFKFVEIKKQEGMPLVKVFAQYANKTMRQANSVRNYYYRELSQMLDDRKRADALDINLKNHVVTKSKPFSQDEESDVLKKINELKNKGYSVRKACLELSNGNVSTMIRLQNKYRALTKSEQKPMGEIIKMPVRYQKLNDDDIKALFMGLVKLVKKQEAENARIVFENEIYSANQKLQKVMAELSKKRSEVEKLKTELVLIKQELDNKFAKRNNSVGICNKKGASAILKQYFYDKKSLSGHGHVAKK